jgi:hypothetical protein
VEERRHVVEWLKASDDDKLDVRVDLRRNLGLRQAHTGEWLYENPKFKDWIDADSEATTLWYHSGPGSGKTIISSYLIKHLQDQGFKVAYFFYSFYDPTGRKFITAIRSLALQIMTQMNTIPDQVMKLYEADVANHVFALRDHQTAIMVLQAFLNLPSRIYIVLDGLDECYDGLLMRSSLSRLASTHTYGVVKWFFTSRNEKEIQIMAHQLGSAEIEPSEAVVITDIKRYLEDRTTRDDYPLCCLESWADASGGNFLWISLMLNILVGMDLTCDEEIEEELKRFPTGLTGCYLRSLEQLSLRSKQHQALARRIFTMLVVAEQPLHLSELSNALGIREGADYYSAGRVPKLPLIEELCSHLVIFDRASKGNQGDPLLKLAHKSVQDFFIQNPDSLEMPIPDGLRQFFVNQKLANLEMGKACLTYLNYKRYLKPLDDIKILYEDGHAFLRYAATFWFWHLMRTSHSNELFSSVEQFIQSPAFWTCLIVQCNIAPHLFAQLIEMHSGHYRLDAGRLGDYKTSNDQRLNFAFPLPEWLDTYSPSGPLIVQEFLCFIKEWHFLLTSYPQALGQCIRDFSGNTYPCRNPSQSEGIRVLRLHPSGSTSTPSKSLLQTLRVKGGTIQATVIQQEVGSQRKLIVRQLCVNDSRIASPKISEEAIYEQIVTTNSSTYHIHTSADTTSRNISAWVLELGDLKMIRDNGLQMNTFMAPEAIEKLKSSQVYDTQTPWAIELRPPTNDDSTIFGLYCFKTSQFKQDENDSGYGPSSGSESDDESDDELNDGLGDEYPGTTYYCLVLVSHDYSPLWFSWQNSTQTESQVVFAAHPTEPIAIWSHITCEFRLADLRTGRIKCGILPEPVDIQLCSASATRKGKFTTVLCVLC